jgi:hypothetical protein
MRASNESDSTPVSRSPGPDMRLRLDELATIMRIAGWTNAELARQTGLDQSAVQRLREGKLQLGRRSIAGLLIAVWRRFGDTAAVSLFEVIADDGQAIPMHVHAQAENGPRAASA